MVLDFFSVQSKSPKGTNFLDYSPTGPSTADEYVIRCNPKHHGNKARVAWGGTAARKEFQDHIAYCCMAQTTSFRPSGLLL
jgi:hypothetical protein